MHLTTLRLMGEGFSVFVKETELISYLKVEICGATTWARFETTVIRLFFIVFKLLPLIEIPLLKFNLLFLTQTRKCHEDNSTNNNCNDDITRNWIWFIYKKFDAVRMYGWRSFSNRWYRVCCAIKFIVHWQFCCRRVLSNRSMEEAKCEYKQKKRFKM